MSVAARLAAYGALLALVVTGAFAVGGAVGPLPTAAGDAPAPVAVPAGHTEAAGLASSAGGYALVPAGPLLTAGSPQPFAFRITGPDGGPVTAFDVEHDKRMHLIVVRRDGTAFQHVHPEMAPDGTWSVPLTVPAGGSYRAFADFAPTGGAATTLGVDLSAAGVYEPVTHAPSRTAQVDGYTVDLTGDLVPGRTSPVTLTVRRAGLPVTDLQPYPGANGHLVALREGDLAYLHVHPEGAAGSGPGIAFAAEVPSAGTYRLFLDFRHDGVVRTAEFTVPTTAAGPGPAEPRGEPGHGH